MATTADEVVALAKGTKSISQEQMARILQLTPTMKVEDLDKLKQMILDVREAEIADMKREIEIRQKVGAAYQEWKADTARNALQAKEGAVQTADSAQAENLIKNI